MKDLKNTVTTICALVIAICAAVIPVLEQGTWHPAWLITILGVIGAIAAAIIGIFTGRNADGTRKTNSQIEKQKNSKQ